MEASRRISRGGGGHGRGAVNPRGGGAFSASHSLSWPTALLLPSTHTIPRCPTLLNPPVHADHHTAPPTHPPPSAPPYQGLNLQSPGCDSVGTTIHEIAHALGISHEQSRPDRDQFVRINWNVIPGGTGNNNFQIKADADTARPYDILSVMHYGQADFSTTPGVNAIDIRLALVVYHGQHAH